MTRRPLVPLPDVLGLAREDAESVVDLTRRLVAVPSRGGIDDYGPVLDVVAAWFADHGLTATTLAGDRGEPVGLVCRVSGGRPGPCWVLDACLDTAPFGDEAAWTHPPTGAVVEDGWLWGRGSADSKVGAAIFCHVARRVAEVADELAGDLVVLLDVDEHTGLFGGARAFFESLASIDEVGGVLIGYPGLDEVVVGSRGVLRAELVVHGVAGHSGSKAAGLNAIEKAADLVRALAAAPLPSDVSAAFPVAPKLSVTAIYGGEGYTVTPDLCALSVDVRTTPSFDAERAVELVDRTIAEVDTRWPGTAPTRVDVVMHWPAYALNTGAPLRRALLDAIDGLGLKVADKISGPSNIGNYLATLGIPATAGFGVRYEGLHAVDERIELSTISAVQAAYHLAVLRLLGCAPPAT